MSLTFSTYVSQIANLAVISSNDGNFQTMLPGAIDYAEGRIYRELDLLSLYVIDASASFAPQNRTFTLPTTVGTFEILEEVSAITPSGATTSNGTRNPLVATSEQFINAVYPSNTAINGVPQFYARISATQIIVGPAADQNYLAEVYGTQNPTPLSATNPTTFLTAELPDLLIAATMVFVSGYQRDFSAQGDNPQMGVSWESQYKTLFQSAQSQELRKQFTSQGWTSEQVNPIATPPRV